MHFNNSATCFHIRSDDTGRFIFSGSDGIEPKLLIAYENIILVRSSNCHFGFGRCSHFRPDHPEHYYSNEQADWHESQIVSRRGNRRNQRCRARPQHRLHGLHCSVHWRRGSARHRRRQNGCCSLDGLFSNVRPECSHSAGRPGPDL